MRGRLRKEKQKNLYDIRRGWAAFGRFLGAGRRLREVRGSWAAPSGGSWAAPSAAFGRFVGARRRLREVCGPAKLGWPRHF